MRISDWSSDVCSSDLEPGEACRRLPSPTHRLIGRALSSSGRIELPGYPRAAVAVLKCRASAKGDKMPKLKTKSGVKKRFKLTATGKVKQDRKSTRLNSSH